MLTSYYRETRIYNLKYVYKDNVYLHKGLGNQPRV